MNKHLNDWRLILRIKRIEICHLNFRGTVFPVLLLAVLLSGCSYMEKIRPGGDDAKFKKIERVVKSELVRDERIDAAPLRVQVVNDVIVLMGFVESESERESARNIAARLYPRYRVENEIEVR